MSEYSRVGKDGGVSKNENVRQEQRSRVQVGGVLKRERARGSIRQEQGRMSQG